MNKTERRVIRNLITKLGPDSRAIDSVKEALTGPARVYIRSWIIAPLELLIKEDRERYDLDLADRMSR